MPGTTAPAAVRFARYSEGCLNQQLVEDEEGHYHAPCIAHGDYVKVESLQADHFQAKAEILRRQQQLIQLLNEDPNFATFMMQQSGMDKFFVQLGTVYYGTLFFYELYFNDIDNIWLIYQACNLQKNDEAALTWIEKHWAYKDEFIEYLATLDRGTESIILQKVGTRAGLAQAAIEWFWKRHANYVSVAKQFFETVKVPVSILNRKIDYVIGSGSQERAQRLEASLEFKMNLLGNIANSPGLGMPKGPDESSHSSSDETDRLKVVDAQGMEKIVPLEVYRETGKEVAANINTIVAEALRTRILETAGNSTTEPTQTKKI